MRWFWQARKRSHQVADQPDLPRDETTEHSQESDGSRSMQTFPPHVFAVTDVGRVREHNEDAYHVSGDGNLFVVADGMGGHEAGEVAAAQAIGAIVEYLLPERLTAAAEEGELSSVLLEAVLTAHGRVSEANRSRESGKEMGCTIAVGYVFDHRLVTCHVGDVRCYISSRGVLRQITHDHSFVGSLVQAGQLTPEEARVHPNKNEVLQAIGMPAGIVPDVNGVDLATGDRILLCSDGLWEALPNQDIEAILTSDGTSRQLATQLVGRANGAGGTDNITAVLIEVGHFPERPARGPHGEGGKAGKGVE